MYYIYFWMPIIITVIGTTMLSNLLEEVGIDTEPFLLPFFIVFITAYVFFLVYWFGIQREKFQISQIQVD